MMIRSIAAALLLCAACVDEGSDSDQEDPTIVEPDKPQDPLETPSSDTTDPRDNFQPDTINADLTCDIVADPDDPYGPCAHACDPDGLEQFVPEGACFTFACHDKHGQLQKIGACNID